MFSVFMFVFVFRSNPGEPGLEPLFTYLEHFDVDFVGAGATFYRYRHQCSLSVMFIFTAARSLALRARGLRTSSVWLAVTGRLVSKRSSAS
jgi:hypothetical protein